MATGEEYLHTVYDCDYVDVVIEERNVGEYDHSNLQGALVAFLFPRRKEWKMRALPPQRVQVYTSTGTYEATDFLRTENPEMVVPLAEIFASLD